LAKFGAKEVALALAFLGLPTQTGLILIVVFSNKLQQLLLLYRFSRETLPTYLSLKQQKFNEINHHALQKVGGTHRNRHLTWAANLSVVFLEVSLMKMMAGKMMQITLPMVEPT